ncbi:MAG: OmpA family protein [Sulfurimonas sp.]|nr:OmpA family protein [Sulfurimonas sp.]
MKKTIFIVFSTLLALSLNAQELIENKITQKNLGEYGYIQPIAIEEAPIKKTVKPEPLDKDGDGVFDNDDRCPNSAAGAKVDKFGCLVLDDKDKDGVPDKDDKCPNTKEGTSVDYRGCELDSDDDGIVDSKDRCPNTSKDFVVDGYGCPQTATLKVNFSTGKFNINQNLIDDLQSFALFLKENKGYDLTIYGYTDSTGKLATNQILSQKRADAVKEVLTRYGISATRMTSIGKGEADPVASNKTKEGRAQNRRIEVELTNRFN